MKEIEKVLQNTERLKCSNNMSLYEHWGLCQFSLLYIDPNYKENYQSNDRFIAYHQKTILRAKWTNKFRDRGLVAFELSRYFANLNFPVSPIVSKSSNTKKWKAWL